MFGSRSIPSARQMHSDSPRGARVAHEPEARIGHPAPVQGRERQTEPLPSTTGRPSAPLAVHPALTEVRGERHEPFYLVRTSRPAAQGGRTPEGLQADAPSTAVRDRYEPKRRLCGLLPPAPPVGSRSKYRIDPDRVLEIVRKAVSTHPELLIRVDAAHFARLEPSEQRRWLGHMDMIRLAQRRAIIADLSKVYGSVIVPDPKTFVYHGGGCHCYLEIIYASVNPFDGEYLAFCWAPWRIDGMANYYGSAVVWDYIMEGENHNYATAPRHGLSGFETTTAGEYTFLAAGEDKRWIAESTSMLDHGRGNIAKMIPRAYAPNCTVYFDFQSLGRGLAEQVRAALRTLTQRRGSKGVKGVLERVPEPPHDMPEGRYRERLADAKAYFRPILEALDKDRAFIDAPRE